MQCLFFCENCVFWQALYVNMWFGSCATVIHVSTREKPDNIFTSTRLL